MLYSRSHRRWSIGCVHERVARFDMGSRDFLLTQHAPAALATLAAPGLLVIWAMLREGARLLSLVGLGCCGEAGAATREGQMTRVLFVGQQPETVDFTDPMLPPGMNAEKIHAGIALALKQMAERGWHADLCLLRPDETAGPDVERRLKAQTYDCVVIGAGIRLPPHSLSMFEAVINAVHRAAPDAAIAFNTRPEDSADAAARWLKAD